LLDCLVHFLFRNFSRVFQGFADHGAEFGQLLVARLNESQAEVYDLALGGVTAFAYRLLYEVFLWLRDSDFHEATSLFS
jgi:hypothetical protein